LSFTVNSVRIHSNLLHPITDTLSWIPAGRIACWTWHSSYCYS